MHFSKVWVLIWTKAVLKQLFDLRTAKTARWQTDAVHHNQFGSHTGGALIIVRGVYEPGIQQAVILNLHGKPIVLLLLPPKLPPKKSCHKGSQEGCKVFFV